MRWDNLFDDLESQLEQGLGAEEVDLRAEEERLRLGRLTIRDRLLAVHDSHERGEDYIVRLALTSSEVVPVRPATIGKDWLSGDILDGSKADRQCIVPIASIAGMVLDREGVRRSLAPQPAGEMPRGGALAARLGLPFVLRDLCRRRVGVEIVLGSGGAVVTGTIDRVGRDHLDIAVHEPGMPRRESAVSEYRLVPFGALAFVRL
jgi:hypothetical protein